MSTPRTGFRLLVPLLLLLLAPLPATAQSAADIVEEMREAYLAQTEGIENYTVVQDVLGNEQTMYFVREETEDGVPYFRPQMEMGMESMEMPRSEPGVDEAYFLREEVAERMTHEGMDEVEGEACHLIRLNDFSGLEPYGAGPGEGFELETMTLCVDEDQHVVRRMQMQGTAMMQGESRPISMTAVLKDYREVEGLMHPFVTEMTMEGMAGDSEQQAEVRAAMERMEKQLEQLPEAQRERMRQMMESRMEGMREAMGVVTGEPIVMRTLEVRVNAGPPEGMN